MTLKQISPDAIPHALELAERYRLLNEPEQAASICHDVLAVAPAHPAALKTLFLAITEQFHQRHGTRPEDAEKIVEQMADAYERMYYGAIVYERWARAKRHEGATPYLVRSWVEKAMERYEKAEAMRPAGNDDAILRWNACARLMDKLPKEDDAPRAEFGD